MGTSTTTTQTPTIIVTSERWSRNPYVVFEGDELIGAAIATDWIETALEEVLGWDSDVTREQVEEEIIAEFVSENDSVDEFSAEHNICRAGDYYYKYDSDGMAKWIGNFASMAEAIEG